LVTVDPGEAMNATARVVSLDRFAEDAPVRRLIDALLAPEARLLVVDEGGVRIAHEALLTHWDRARAQIETERKDYQLRGRLELALSLWRNAPAKSRDSLLLPPGLPLIEASDLARRWGDTLDPEIAMFVRTSQQAARRKTLRRFAIGTGLALVVPLAVGAWFATRIAMGVRDIEPGLEFVAIPQGCFTMGSPANEEDRQDDESPAHEVCVGAFRLGKFELTQRQWEKVMLANPSTFKGSPEHPVETVSWEDAARFVRRLNLFGRHHYRLPTEAEWEYAARAGSTGARFWGERSGDACTFANAMDRQGKNHYGKQIGAHFDCDDGQVFTAPVGSYQANPFGLHDMLGNVNEWVADWYDPAYYARAPRDNPTGPVSGTKRIARGGSWYHLPDRVRANARMSYRPDYQNNGVGLRLVRE